MRGYAGGKAFSGSGALLRRSCVDGVAGIPHRESSRALSRACASVRKRAVTVLLLFSPISDEFRPFHLKLGSRNPWRCRSMHRDALQGVQSRLRQCVTTAYRLPKGCCCLQPAHTRASPRLSDCHRVRKRPFTARPKRARGGLLSWMSAVRRRPFEGRVAGNRQGRIARLRTMSGEEPPSAHSDVMRDAGVL